MSSLNTPDAGYDTSISIEKQVKDGNNQVAMMHANIRPGKGLHIGMEIIDPVQAAERDDEIRITFVNFMDAALNIATDHDLPVRATNG